jgi:hypothetical protein
MLLNQWSFVAMTIKALWKKCASLNITIVCLSFFMILVFIGTLSQVDLGIYYAQKKYFESFFVMGSLGAFRFPYLPGGFLLGGVLLLNVIAALTTRMTWSLKKMGIISVHIGLILLLGGGAINTILTTESQMPITEGERKLYSQHLRYVELALIDESNEDHNIFIQVPQSELEKEGIIEIKEYGVSIQVHRFFENSQVSSSEIVGTRKIEGLTHGIGQHLFFKPLTPFVRDDLRNNASAILSFIGVDGAKEKRLLSLDLNTPQDILVGSKPLQVVLRPLRFYNTYSLYLKDFKHDLYPGTDIPKNFSSDIILDDFETGEKRDFKIYMNHPLRYKGKTYFQASFAANDTISIFQVVDNPGWLLPYLSCLIITLGMGIQFSSSLFMFISKGRHRE